MITAALAFAVALTTGGPPDPPDTPTEEIDSVEIAEWIASDDPAVAANCETHRGAVMATDTLPFIRDLDPATANEWRNILNEMYDAKFIVDFEGDTLRLTPEAREVLLAWLHFDCS